MPATPAASSKSTTRFGVTAVLAIAATVLIISAQGCAKPSTSNWAQTSPVMNADSTTNSVNLGVRD